MKAAALILFLLFGGALGREAVLRLLEDAVIQGAVCLDGSAPGYYIRAGTGNGASKWIVHLEGGGLCFTEEMCFERSKNSLGSSIDFPPSKQLSGFLSDDPEVNPDFYDWNIVQLQYCDGGVYSADVEDPYFYSEANTTLYFRGFRILKVSIEALLLEGLSNATDIILSGSSAGGLATYIHIDQVAAMLPSTANFVGLADGGFFVDAPNIHGIHVLRQASIYVNTFMDLVANAPPECLNQYAASQETWKCGFPASVLPYIETPIFILNSQYDTWSLNNVVMIKCQYPPTSADCSEQEIAAVDNFREEWLSQAQSAIDATSGAFIDSCFVHTQANSDQPWMTIEIDNRLMRDVFADWYYGRGVETNLVDCPYPCNPTCSAGNAATSGAVGSTLLCLMSAVVMVFLCY